MFKKQNITIGLDLGTSYIKIVKLEKSDSHPLIKDLLVKKISSKENLSSLLQEGLVKTKTEGIPLNISLSGPNVVCRYIDLPILAEQEFKNALKFEVSQYIPFSPQEVYFDGYILKKDTTRNKMSVVISAAKRDFLNQYLKLIKDLGYEVGLVDVDCLALANCFNFSKAETIKNKTVGILNLGASFSNLNIIEGGTPVLSRDVRIAGNEITAKISSELNCDFNTAEKIKIEASNDDNQFQKIRHLLENVLSMLAQEIRVSFDYYESQSVSTVESLYLCGGQALLKPTVDILKDLLGIEVSIFDPLEGFGFSKEINPEEIKKNSLYLAVALGLGLR